MKTISSYSCKLDLSSSKVKGLSPSSVGASFTLGMLRLNTFGLGVISFAKLRHATGDSDAVPSSMISVVFFGS